MSKTKPSTTTAHQVKPATKSRREKSRHQAVPYLPSFVDMACDAVGQLLSTGGHDQDVTDLVRLCIRHLQRQSWPSWYPDSKKPEVLESELQAAVEKAEPRWKATIQAGWKQAEEKPAEAMEPKTVTESIRSFVHSQVASQLQTFLNSAGPEEKRFMLDVLEDRNQDFSSSMTAWPEHEIPIATWFEYHSTNVSFDNKLKYVRVPENLAPKVAKYVEALIAVEGVVE